MKTTALFIFLIMGITTFWKCSGGNNNLEDETIDIVDKVPSYLNPILKRSGDPFCMKDGDTYFLYLPRQASNNTGGAVEVYTSKNIAGPWILYGDVYSNVDVSYDGFDSEALFAPEVLRLDVDGQVKYFLYVVNVMSGAQGGAGNADIAIIEGSSPFDFNPESMKVLVGKEDNNYRYIDPNYFKDSDNSLWLSYKIRRYDGSGTQIEIVQAETGNPMVLKAGTSPIEILSSTDVENANAIVEHPYLYKKNGVYYFFYSSGQGDGDTYKIGYRTSNNILGPYDKRNDALMFTGQNNGVVSPGAVSIVEDCSDSNNLWMVYRQKLNKSDGFSNREIYADKMIFNTSDKTVICEATRGTIENPPMGCN